jgi:hypothetical protein
MGLSAGPLWAGPKLYRPAIPPNLKGPETRAKRLSRYVLAAIDRAGAFEGVATLQASAWLLFRRL